MIFSNISIDFLKSLLFTATVLRKKVSLASQSVREGSQTVHEGSRIGHEGSFACNIATNFKLHAQMGCVIIYYTTGTQIANLLCKSPVRNQFMSQFTSHFMPHRLVHDSYTFMLREAMYLHTHIHASIVKHMGHEITREA